MKVLRALLSTLWSLFFVLAVSCTYPIDSRNNKHDITKTRKFNPHERKLIGGMLGSIGGAAVGGYAAYKLTGVSREAKRNLRKIKSDIQQEKQKSVTITMNRGAVIQEIDSIITRSEEKLQELHTRIVANIHALNSLVESSNMKQVKAIKTYLNLT